MALEREPPRRWPGANTNRESTERPWMSARMPSAGLRLVLCWGVGAGNVSGPCGHRATQPRIPPANRKIRAKINNRRKQVR